MESNRCILLRITIALSIVLLSLSPVLSAPSLYGAASLGSYDFTFEFTMRNAGQGEARAIRGELPVMAWNDLPPYQSVKSVISDPPVIWNKNGHTISFSVSSLQPRDSFRMNIKYQIELSECFQDPPNVPAGSNYPGPAMAKYLRAEHGIEVGHPQIVAVLNQLGIQSNTPKEKARRIFAFVTEALDYRIDFFREASALNALKTKWGRCEDYAVLFVALCRTAGIPARVAYGFRLDQNEMRGKLINLNEAGHAWAEAYLPVVGWISVDPTYIALNKGVKVIDYRHFAGFYPDDIHIFTHYGAPEPRIYYEKYKDNVRFEYRSNYFLTPTSN